jgi:hypothetical protein
MLKDRCCKLEDTIFLRGRRKLLCEVNMKHSQTGECGQTVKSGHKKGSEQLEARGADKLESADEQISRDSERI